MTSENPTSGATDSTRYLVGVDVGTGSARAGIFDLAGRMMASAKRDITLFHASGSIVEQSSGEIWNAVCHAVKDALSQAGLAVAEHPRPHPRDAIVERGCGLGLRDQTEHLARREMH